MANFLIAFKNCNYLIHIRGKVKTMKINIKEKYKTNEEERCKLLGGKVITLGTTIPVYHIHHPKPIS